MLSAVAPEEHGRASGATTAIRELAVAALWLAAGFAAVGVLAAALPRPGCGPQMRARSEPLVCPSVDGLTVRTGCAAG